MARSRVQRSRNAAIGACAALAVSLAGCGLAEPPAAGEAAPTAAASSALTPRAGCTAAATGAWSNDAFREQNQDFFAEFDATPSAAGIDAVVGLGDHTASRFSDLAVIVRFNSSGMIDARDGSTYRAGRPFPYQAGHRYHVRLAVFPQSHVYAVLIRNGDSPDDSYTDLGLAFAFRTEQAGVTRLNTVATEADSTAGTLTVCNAVVAPRPPAPPGCAVVNAGEGLVTFQVSSIPVFDVIAFRVQPSVPNIDAVVGLSSGIPAGFADLATSVRFSPSGVLDVRDGDTYRADRSQPYDLRPVDFRMISDVRSHTYSVFAGAANSSSPTAAPLELARQYGFRTQQRGIRHLEFLSAIVDGGAGSVTICNIDSPVTNNISYSREGRYSVAPLPGDHALLSDGATTRHVDATGQVVTTINRGGELAADPLGNAFIASLSGATLTVESYDPNLAFRWGIAMIGAFQNGNTIKAMTVAPDGAALLAIDTSQAGQPRTFDIWRFTQAGPTSILRGAAGSAAGFDGDQTIITSSDNGVVRIRRFDVFGRLTLIREFTGAATLTAVAADTDHDIVFGGALSTNIDFGGGVLVAGHPSENPEINAFVVTLSSTGAHRFSTKTGGSVIEGIAAGDQRIAVSDTMLTQFQRERLFEFTPTGAGISTGLVTGLGEFGRGGRVYIGNTGRVWWNFTTQWPRFDSWPYLIAVQE